MRNDDEDLSDLLRTLSEASAADLPSVLGPLVARPRVLCRLDEWIRASYYVRAASEAGAAATVLAAMHRDGRIREQAVAELAGSPDPTTIPILVLRTGDWVRQVRDRARRAVGDLFAAAPAAVVPVVLPVAGYTARRDPDRGGWAMDQVRETVRTAFDDVAPVLLRTRHGLPRRLAFECGTALGRWSYPDLVRFALRDRDGVVRDRAAVAAVDEAVRRSDLVTLRTLATSRYTAVRINAVVGLLRPRGKVDAGAPGDEHDAATLGDDDAGAPGDEHDAATLGDDDAGAPGDEHDAGALGDEDDVRTALDDTAPLVRAYARSRSADPLAHYREAAAAAPTTGVIAGLGETGGYSDAGLLTPLLRHADPKIRAATAQALTKLDAVPVDEVTPLLRDPSAAVIRAAAIALRPLFGRLPSGLAWDLLADDRAEVRLGAYRLLSFQSPEIRLRAALLLAAGEQAGDQAGDQDGDLPLAERARLDAVRIVSERRPLDGDRDDLIRLAGRVGEDLARGVRQLPHW